MARGGRGGRRGGGQARPSKPVKKGSKKPVQKDDDMMYDEVDRYHNAKQSLSMNVEDDAADSADDSALDDEAAVFDVDAADESTSEEDDEALEEDIQRGGRTAQMARTARALGMRLKQQAAEFGADDVDDEAEEEDEEAAAGRGARWGASKRAYHGADTADASDDEEAAQEEEAEAVRLQREAAAGLRPEDYADGLELDGEDEDAGGSGEDEDADEAADRTMGGAAARAEAGVEVEEVEKDLDTLDEQAQRAAVAADAPELGALLAELRANLAEVRTRVGPLVKEVRAGQLATAEGVSYLEAKNLLLLSYCTHIVFYLLLKAEGRPVRTHPVIGRLLQIRAYLEKLRPIDKKLQYQMDKLLRAAAQLQQPGSSGAAATAAANGSTAAADPLSFGPNPDQLLPKVPLPRDGGGAGPAAEGAGEGPADGGDGLYRPPRNVAVSMEDDPDRRRSAKERRQERDHGKRAARSALLRELAHEVEGAPEEVGAAGAAAGMDTAVARRQLRQLEARAAAEEDLMMRVPLSKEQRKAVKAQRRAGLSGKALLDDFGDDVADLVDMADGLGRQSGNDGVDAGFQRTTISQRFGGALASGGLKGRATGDDDLPLREPLHERRAKYDAVRAKQTAADDDDGDDVLPGGAVRSALREREMDDTYTAVAEAAAARKKARKAAPAPAMPPPLPEEEADGARGINQAIEKNRGLTPHRSKALKNPRKKHRIKFAQANVRRAGQVQPMREKSAGYGGEATGIKSKVSKSRRF